MLILDTHAWIWWTDGSEKLNRKEKSAIEREDQIGICAISCWEVAKLVELSKVSFSLSIDQWREQALSHSKIELLPLTPEIAIEASRLPGTFHRDPYDQLIVATARLFDCPLLTHDQKIQQYPHVKVLGKELTPKRNFDREPEF